MPHPFSREEYVTAARLRQWSIHVCQPHSPHPRLPALGGGGPGATFELWQQRIPVTLPGRMSALLKLPEIVHFHTRYIIIVS